MIDLNEHIALALKQLRKDCGWSLDKTSQQTGVSKAMLGQIERGESSPTISTLWKIANGFQISFSSMIEGLYSESNDVIVSSKQVQNYYSFQKEFQVRTILPFDAQLSLEMFEIIIQPGHEHLAKPHEHAMYEHVITINGSMEVLMDGHWQLLKKGKAIRFKANQPHGYRNASTKSVTFHNMIHYKPHLY